MIPVSFEFYPPKTDEQREQLRRTVRKLRAHQPEFVSVTFGAGGSTLSYTPETVRELRQAHKLNGVPHLSCMGGTREEIRELLNLYRALGCDRVVALRGDLPSGMARMGDLRHASDLVAFIRAEHGEHFHIDVGCYPEMHPQAEDSLADLRRFKEKMDAGANSAISQYFYNADAYFRFVDDVRRLGVVAPIIPGIMPISNFTSDLQFHSAQALLRSLRRRDPALDQQAHGRFWRRFREHPRVCFRPGRGDVPATARRGRAGTALLHLEPGQADGVGARAARVVEWLG